MNNEPKWTSLSDEALLRMRICDLKLDISQSRLSQYQERLHEELEQKGLHYFKPFLYLGDEWFSPEGTIAISVPFYLAHPRLIALERKIMYEVEGEDAKWFMRLLRHEAGHCFDHAYGLSRKKDWRRLFGPPNKVYDPDHFSPRPYSRSFVKNLDNFYAQAHPDEDFAETFAVWLNPNLDWKETYQNWNGAYEKLQFVDQAARTLGQKPMRNVDRTRNSEAKRLKSTLEKYYNRRRKENEDDFPDFFDADLTKIFGSNLGLSETTFPLSAGKFLRRHHKLIVDLVSRWSGTRKYMVNRFVRKLKLRCLETNIQIQREEKVVLLELTNYITAIVTHYKFTGRFKRTV